MTTNFENMNVKDVLIAHAKRDLNNEKLVKTVERSEIEILTKNGQHCICITAKSTKHKKLLLNQQSKFHQILTTAFQLSPDEVEFKFNTAKDKRNTPVTVPATASKPEKVNAYTPYSELVFGDSNQNLKFALDHLLTNTMFYEQYFISGPNASGKSTIMRSFNRELISKGLSTKIITALKYLHQFVERVRSKNWTGWDNQFTKFDVLIIEDISMIKTRKKILDSLLQILSEYTSLGNKHLLITSQESVQSLGLQSQELFEFFESMTPLQIEKPSEDIIAKLLNNFLQKQQITCPLKVKRKLIAHFVSKPHTFTGITKSIFMKYQAMLTTFSADLANDGEDKASLFAKAVDDVLKNTKSTINITGELIITNVCEFYQIDKNTLLKPGRTEPVLEARQMASYLLKNEMGWSFPKIGTFFGQSHTTALNSVNKIAEILKNEAPTSQQNNYCKLLAKLK